MRTITVIISLLLTTTLMAQQRVRIIINSLPDYHPSASTIYIAGSFNGWNPQDEKCKFALENNKTYYLSLPLNPGAHEFKITRGGWDKVECAKGGQGIANRKITVPNDKGDLDMEMQLTIEEWQDRFPSKPRVSTASKRVQIIDTAFWIPQLKRTRRIWIYLPQEYEVRTNHRFPVLYMHDGQNVFDDATSFSGEWGIDEYLDTMGIRESIVVAIDHGGDKRMTEYNPYDNERFGKGEGNAYVDFIVKTLKPFIDKKYRTLKERKYTLIAGSSMGGLISMYAALRYPKVFGGVGVFSPAFWISGAKIFNDIKSKGKKVKANIYLYAGKQESNQMVPDMLRALQVMSAVSKSKIKSVIRDEGKHNEATWRKEFPDGYAWMSYGVEPTVIGISQ